MVQEKIEKRSVVIDKCLYDEIKYARDNLNRSEKKKKSGVKREKHTFLTASNTLGKHLKSLRGSSK